MRPTHTLALTIGLLASCGIASATLTFSQVRYSVDTTDRVVLFVKSEDPADQLLAADLRIRTTGGAMIWANPGGEYPLTIPITRSNLFTVENTRVATGVFHSILPGSPVPSNQAPDEFSLPPLAAGNITDFHVVGFDGRPEPFRGTDAGPSVNLGRGAALAAAVVPMGTVVNWTGQVATESGLIKAFVVQSASAPATPVAFSQSVYRVRLDFGNSSAPRSFSVPVQVTSPDTGAVISVGFGAADAGFRSLLVTPQSGTSPLNAVVSGTLDRLPRRFFRIPVLAAAEGGSIFTSTIEIEIIPEPATVSLVAMGSILLLRRR